jgi:hypothetical protein
MESTLSVRLSCLLRKCFFLDFLHLELICFALSSCRDNNYTLYVNDKPIGSGTNFNQAQVYTASLDFSLPNVFAVLAGNTGGPAGLIGTFLITYSDGTTETFVTDSSWRTFVGNAGVEDTGPLVLDELPPWVDAVEIASNGQLAIWPPVTIPSALGGAYERSSWIYPAEGNPRVSEPGGIHRGLRKTIDAPGPYGCKCGTCAQVVISAYVLYSSFQFNTTTSRGIRLMPFLNSDDNYLLYMNGKQVGSGQGFNTPQYFTITGLEGFSEVFAINTTNIPPETPAAVIAAILIAYDDGTSNITSTDGSWKALPSAAPPAGFQDVNFNDASWPAAEVLGTYGITPWGTFPIPQA